MRRKEVPHCLNFMHLT